MKLANVNNNYVVDRKERIVSVCSYQNSDEIVLMTYVIYTGNHNKMYDAPIFFLKIKDDLYPKMSIGEKTFINNYLVGKNVDALRAQFRSTPLWKESTDGRELEMIDFAEYSFVVSDLCSDYIDPRDQKTGQDTFYYQI